MFTVNFPGFRLLLSAFLFFSILSGCVKLPYEIGMCEISYNNIERLPSQSLKVKVIDQDKMMLNFTLIPYENTITLPLDAGYSYSLETETGRKDTLYNVMVIRYGKNNEKLKYYTFMFNNTIHDNYNNLIGINL